jgi:hypothetical protein
MQEKIEGKEQLKEGPYTFEVMGVPQKKTAGKGFKRIWVFTCKDVHGETRKQNFFLFPNEYYPIVLALGGVKNGKDVDWDDEEVQGKSFSCDLKIVKNGEYSNYKFENCKAEIPF